jgi:hypothetical protein
MWCPGHGANEHVEQSELYRCVRLLPPPYSGEQAVRIVFRFDAHDAHDVRCTDYH